MWLVDYVEWLFYIWWEPKVVAGLSGQQYLFGKEKGKKEISNLDVVMSYCLAITANNPMRSEGR